MSKCQEYEAEKYLLTILLKVREFSSYSQHLDIALAIIGSTDEGRANSYEPKGQFRSSGPECSIIEFPKDSGRRTFASSSSGEIERKKLVEEEEE